MQTAIINQLSYNLDEILQDCWHRLINGTNSSKHPFHSPSIASINEGAPEIRTVILRKVIPADNILIFHTDYRSPKIIQLKNNNILSWLFYDAKSRLQLRVKTTATIHYKDAISFKRWNDSRLESRKCYLAEPAPSTRAESSTDGLPPNLEDKDLTDENVLYGYDHFAVIENKVIEIDWLVLNHDGHRRAKFLFSDQGVDKFWMIP